MSTWAQATERACQRIPERTRCVPEFTGCPQLSRCACANADRRGTVIDASVSIRALGFCPMFVDSRGPMTDELLGPLAQHSPPDVVAVLDRRRQVFAARTPAQEAQ